MDFFKNRLYDVLYRRLEFGDVTKAPVIIWSVLYPNGRPCLTEA